jgi:hypothetical protein
MSGSNVQQNNEQILNDIQYLQQLEQQMFNNLETNPNLSTQQQEEIIKKMNQISNMRINLYKTLSGVNNFFQNALTSSVGTLQEQTAAIAIVESELNRSKNRLETLNMERNNKIRLVEINDYYGEKYSDHSNLMKIIIFTLVPVIILAFLNNKGILPNIFYYILLCIVSLIGAIFFWKRFMSIIFRDNMNYQQYEWYFIPKNVNSNGNGNGNGNSTDPWASLSLTGTCVAQNCCSTGQIYDPSLNQCVGNSTVNVNLVGLQASNSAAASNSLYGDVTSAVGTITGGVTSAASTVGNDFSSISGFTDMREAMTVQKALTKTAKSNNTVQPNNSQSFLYK